MWSQYWKKTPHDLIGFWVVLIVFVCPPGWGEISSSHTKSESSWGEPASSPVSVDNGTSAWGKPSGNCGGWGESNPESYGRGNPTMTPASCKPGKWLSLVQVWIALGYNHTVCVAILLKNRSLKILSRWVKSRTSIWHKGSRSTWVLHINLHWPLVAILCFWRSLYVKHKTFTFTRCKTLYKQVFNCAL